MMDLLFNGHAGWFAVPAIVGTFFFALRIVLLFMGGDGDVDVDASGDLAIDTDMDLDAIGDGTGADHTDSDASFKLLSVQSIAAFMMGFGWGGLGALRGAGWEWPTALLVALGSGGAMMYLLGICFQFILSLQSSGTVNMSDAVGAEGKVYVTVPEDGTGQVTLVISGRQRTCNATSTGGPLPTGTRVRVLSVQSDNTLTVSPV